MTSNPGVIDPATHLSRLRRRCPLVHNITNLVAIGASPAMVHAREEAAEFAGLADALHALEPTHLADLPPLEVTHAP